MTYFHAYREGIIGERIKKSLDEGEITPRDAEIINEYIAEIGMKRGQLPTKNHLYTLLIVAGIRSKPFVEWTYKDFPIVINEIKNGKKRGNPDIKRNNGDGYSQNTQRDLIATLKKFFLWMNREGYTSIEKSRIEAITPPPKDSMTKTAAMLLTEAEVEQFIKACRTSRDRALFSVLYDGGFRIKELAVLNWSQVKFDENGAIVNVDDKTGKPRRVRIIWSVPYLATWRRDHEDGDNPDALVFTTWRGGDPRPLTYQNCNNLARSIARKAGISRNISLHLFRHSRITDLMKKGLSESNLKRMMWGNERTGMLATYGHLTDSDTDNALLALSGVRKAMVQESINVPVICVRCNHINPGKTRFCGGCGMELSPEAADEKRKLEEYIERRVKEQIDEIMQKKQ